MVDASVALAWYFPGEGGSIPDALLDEVLERGAVVPIHWRTEVANAFVSGVRRAKFPASYRADALRRLAALDITVDIESDEHLWGRTQEICDEYELSAYDGAYLELALRRRLPLATLDRKLARSAESAGVALSILRRAL